ncbi:MAG: ParB/RepB/Spo0J family partition protein [Elusimicrobiota bacterium]
MSKALGKGLEALIPGWKQKHGVNTQNNIKTTHIDEDGEIKESLSAPQLISYVSIDAISPHSKQPRNIFNEGSLKELAESIKTNGILQPIVVTHKDGKYTIIAGERRYRAAKIAGIKEVPVLVRDDEEFKRYELALIENIQREDLNPMEEAEAYEYLMQQYSLSQEELAEKVKKNRSTIANVLRLLTLSDDIRDAVRSGAVSSGQARALVSIPDENVRRNLMEEIISKGVSVRRLEEIARGQKGKTSSAENTQTDPEIAQLEQDLIRKIGARVKIQCRGKGQNIKGSIKIPFVSLDDLNRILEIIKL